MVNFSNRVGSFLLIFSCIHFLEKSFDPIGKSRISISITSFLNSGLKSSKALVEQNGEISSHFEVLGKSPSSHFEVLGKRPRVGPLSLTMFQAFKNIS